MTTSLEQQLQEYRDKFGKREFIDPNIPSLGKVRADSTFSFMKEYLEFESFLKEALTAAEKRGAERVVRWIRNYSRRICTNDATGNKRPDVAEMVVTDGLLEQALHSNDTSV